MKDSWLEVVNLKKLIDFSRKVVYYNFDEQNNDLNDKDFLEKIDKIELVDEAEIEDILPYREIESIFAEFLKRRVNKKSKKKAWFIKEKDYDVVLSQMNERMVSNIVRNLVNKGLVESAFDSNHNDFVFWVKKNNEETEKEENN